MFALVEIAGKQYKVSKGDVLLVDRLTDTEGEMVEFKRVFLVSDEKRTKVGQPTVKGVVVKAKVQGHEKGDKIDVRRFKSKVRYRKSMGFRPSFTRVEIVSIS